MKYAISALHCFTSEAKRKSLSDVQVIAGRYLGRDKFTENIQCVSPTMCHINIPDGHCSKMPPSDEQVSIE